MLMERERVVFVKNDVVVQNKSENAHGTVEKQQVGIYRTNDELHRLQK